MRVFPLGDSAATIEFGNEISIDLNKRALALAELLADQPFNGLIEAVPAYASVTVFYDPQQTRYETVKRDLTSLSDNISAPTDEKLDVVEIPISISPDTSPDLGRLAEYSSLSEDEVIDIFLSRAYQVYMLGFLPGFPYMGEVDDRIAAPRLGTPRTKVAQGSIGIAGKQTGIYPLESPGGWNIIGRTDLRLFDPASDQPCLLKPGDGVRFVRC